GPFFTLSGDALVLDRSFEHTRAYRLWSMLTPVKRHSLLVSALLRWYSAIRQDPWLPVPCRQYAAGMAPQPYLPRVTEAIAVTRHLVLEVMHATRAHGARLAVFNASRADWDCDQPNAVLAEVSRTHDIPYLDLTIPMEAFGRQTGAVIFGCTENR